MLPIMPADRHLLPSVQCVGSCALNLCSIAAGRADAFYEIGFGGPWDVAAGGLILEEAGGAVKDPAGGRQSAEPDAPSRFTLTLTVPSEYVLHCGPAASGMLYQIGTVVTPLPGGWCGHC